MGGRGSSSSSLSKSSVSGKISLFERENYMSKTEKGLLIKADGSVKEFGGTEHHVTGNAGELSEMNGATFTHNHPTDVTFSRDDITNGIVKGNLKELRAVTSSGDVHILRNNGATLEQRRKFNIDLEQSKTKARNVAHQKQRRGEIVNVEQYVSQRAEKFMVDNASKYNLFYEKRKIRR